MKRKLQIRLILPCLAAIVGSVLFVRCSNDEFTGRGEPLDDQIVNSMELEDYIVSGYDLYESLDAFKNEISKIDFSKLEFAEDSDGAMVAKVQIQVDIQTKLRTFNEKKDELHRRFPKIASNSRTTNGKYLRECITRSAYVDTRLRELGIEVFTCNTRTNRETFEQRLKDEAERDAFLEEHMADQRKGWVEAVVVRHEDGSYTAYVDSRNTETLAHTPLYEGPDGRWYMPGNPSPVTDHIHTHGTGYGRVPSNEDIAFRNAHPGIDCQIYYNDGFWDY